MGKLINFEDMMGANRKINPKFYGARLEMNTGRYFTLHAAWRSQVLEAHPFRCSIHTSYFEQNDFSSRFWINLRRWIERQAEGDCIYAFEDKSYSWCWSDSTLEFDRKFSKVDHGYWHFNFDVNSDCTGFALLYGDIISEVVDELPDKPKDRKISNDPKKSHAS